MAVTCQPHSCILSPLSLPSILYRAARGKQSPARVQGGGPVKQGAGCRIQDGPVEQGQKCRVKGGPVKQGA
eukprot:1159927-Pelagomonas_calceolata.AAC.1